MAHAPLHGRGCGVVWPHVAATCAPSLWNWWVRSAVLCTNLLDARCLLPCRERRTQVLGIRATAAGQGGPGPPTNGGRMPGSQGLREHHEFSNLTFPATSLGLPSLSGLSGLLTSAGWAVGKNPAPPAR